MDFNNLQVLFFVIICLSIFPLAVSQNPPPLPQEIEGSVEINGAEASENTIIYGMVEGGEIENTSVNSDGNYSIVLSGQDENPVSFYIENEAGEQFEAVTDPEDPTFESGGSVQVVDLEFTIEDPDPVVRTLDVNNKSTDYAVLRTETRFVEEGNLYFEYGEEGTELNRESGNVQIAVQGAESEITKTEIDGLEPNSDYEYKAVLDTDQEIYRGEIKSFTTDNLPPFIIEGSTNTTDTDAEALIDNEVVQQDYIDATGTFELEISYNQSFADKEVTIQVKDEEQILEFRSGETKSIGLEVKKENNQSERKNQTKDTEETSDQESSEQENQDQQDETNSRENVEEQESPENVETDEEQSSSQNQSVTGQFFEGQINGGTTIISFMLLATLAFLTNELI